MEIALRARSLKARLSPLVGLIVAVGTALVLWFGGKLVLAGSLSAGSLLVFIWYLGKMYKPMQDFAKMTDSYSKAAVGYERIQEVFATKPQVQDLPSAQPAPRFKGEIEFDHVQFSYAPDQPVLKDISFKIAPGQMAALVGPTGAGKTTIASLIGRFYDPDSGSVKIDGRDVRDFTAEVASRPDEFHLAGERSVSRIHLAEHCLRQAGGIARRNLSRGKARQCPRIYREAAGGLRHRNRRARRNPVGGQRQRIAIARAIIRDTPILIMDEPSSGLDAASEKLVFEALGRLIEQQNHHRDCSSAVHDQASECHLCR